MMASQMRRICFFRNALQNRVFDRNYLPIKSFSTNTDKLSEQEKEIASRNEARFLTRYRPNGFEKRILVWLKKYPSVDAVPKYVPQNEMERARNKVRIYGMIGMMIVTAFASVGMIYVGKKAAGRGENVTQMNIDWHKKINEESKAK